MDPLTRNRSSPPVQNEARQPRLVHACILLVTAGLTSLATAVLGPSLPKMQEHFASTPGADYLVPLSLTVPMLVMALLSVFAGAAADRVGRKRILVWSTATYALCGTAPLWLKTLDGMFVSRILRDAKTGDTIQFSGVQVDALFGAALKTVPELAREMEALHENMAQPIHRTMMRVRSSGAGRANQAGK